MRGKVYGLPSDDVSGRDEDVFGTRHELRAAGKGDESWEILDDRRASFGSPRGRTDDKNSRVTSEKGDEVELLSRSIPGSYMTERQRAMEENEKGYGSIKSWRSADNGGFGRGAMGRGKVEEEFGGRTKRKSYWISLRETIVAQSCMANVRLLVTCSGGSSTNHLVDQTLLRESSRDDGDLFSPSEPSEERCRRICCRERRSATRWVQTQTIYIGSHLVRRSR